MPRPGGTATLTDDRLDAVFGALADPTRRAILGRLAEGDVTQADLARPLRISVQAVNKHVLVLERAGLIRRRQVASARPAVVQAAALDEVAEWVDQARRTWGSRLDRLDDHLRELQRTSDNPDTPARGPRPERTT